MRDFLRFPFSVADQANIRVPLIVVDDVATTNAPTPGLPYPQSMRFSFIVSHPATGAPQVRALFPGQVRFIVDPAAPGVVPTPAAVDFTDSAYATWKTVGTLMITIADKTLIDALKNLPSRPELLPTVVWYTPVKITKDFLFTTLRSAPPTGLKQGNVGSTPAIKPANPDWAKHAVANFLAGKYFPVLGLGGTAADDDVTKPMPTVVMDALGAGSLFISVARTVDPQDAPSSNFDAPGGPERTDPAHPANGAIPARHVYRSFAANLLDAPRGGAGVQTVADIMLADWPTERKYFPLRFTRTWQAIDNCSVHFPSCSVRVEDTGGNPLMEQRLPSHGLVYLPSLPATPVQNITVSVIGGLYYMDGATPDAWRKTASVAPLAYDLSVNPTPHIIVRRRMLEEMLVEPRDHADGAACTYFSMRRTMRALVDHRITGGRLNFGRASTAPETRKLMDDAWVGTPASSGILARNQPSTAEDPTTAAPKLIPIMSAFFPDPVPAQTIGGNQNRAVIYDGGEMMYRIWQSILADFEEEDTKRNFPDAHIGRGGAGALVAVGLANGYALDPARNPGETDDAYFDRIVGDMLSGNVVQGAVLQFWCLDSDFENMKARSVPKVAGKYALASEGHSPVFTSLHGPAGAPDGIQVIDQTGEPVCPVQGAAGHRLISWQNLVPRPKIWIAANWAE